MIMAKTSGYWKLPSKKYLEEYHKFRKLGMTPKEADGLASAKYKR